MGCRPAVLGPRARVLKRGGSSARAPIRLSFANGVLGTACAFIAHMAGAGQIVLASGPSTVTNAEKKSPSLPGKE